ncbi:hypothetical protein T484DRAFT_1760867 [Baffinella frigidus]|nr:hypothetical protein T484DRAFT_1760867 [Cryptophyta sp. CCMP2293]
MRLHLVYRLLDSVGLGCFAEDNSSRAVASLEGSHALVSDAYESRTDPLVKCAQVLATRP